MNIRLAELKDASLLAGLEALQPLSAGWKEAGWIGELTEPSARVWCAERDGKIIGFLACRLTAGFCEILNVAVHPAHCRQGVGRALLDHALAQVRMHGANTITLEVNEENVPAQRLYVRAGFREVGRRKKFYNHEQDALIFNLMS